MTQVSVTGTATLLLDGRDTASPGKFRLYNSGSTHVYVGSVYEGLGSGVTSSTGAAIPSGGTWTGELSAGDAIYGITAGTTIVMHATKHL